jgi:hypothetical protein
MKIILLLCPIPRQDKKQVSLFAVTQNLDSIERQWRAGAAQRPVGRPAARHNPVRATGCRHTRLTAPEPPESSLRWILLTK